jgi:hypothetical protein
MIAGLAAIIVLGGSLWRQLSGSSRVVHHPQNNALPETKKMGGAVGGSGGGRLDGTGGSKRTNRKQERQQLQQAVIVPRQDRCAVCLYGLPRAFESLVLPSLRENVIRPNARYGCDYFVHYYNASDEKAGRSGLGGRLDPDQIRKLESAVETITEMSGGPPRRPVTLFRAESDKEFWDKHGALVEKVRSTKDAAGQYVYYPWKALTYRHPFTTDNILRMWHSIQESWDLMKSHSQKAGVEYTRVAMLRSDVLYITPIDIWDKAPGGVRDHDNQVAVIPSFGRHPVSDRLIYGPSRAVEVWAAQRFQRMEDHVQWTLKNDPGWGLHSERFVERALLEPIRKLGYSIVEHPTLCFFRARADESVWITDCDGPDPKVTAPTVTQALGSNVREKVEALLSRKCHGVTSQRRPIVTALDCSMNPPKA